MTDAEPWASDAIAIRILDLIGPEAADEVRRAMADTSASGGVIGNIDGAGSNDPRWRGIHRIDLHRSHNWFNYLVRFTPDAGLRQVILSPYALAVMPPLPETVADALPGRPATAVLDHPLLAGLTITGATTDGAGTSISLDTTETRP